MYTKYITYNFNKLKFINLILFKHFVENSGRVVQLRKLPIFSFYFNHTEYSIVDTHINDNTFIVYTILNNNTFMFVFSFRTGESI